MAPADFSVQSTAYTAARPLPDQTSLCSRFFVDDGLWQDAPLLTGQTSFEPLPDVRNIMVTGGEGFIHLVVKYPDAYNVVSFDKLDYCSSRNNSRMLESRPNFKFFHGNITNLGDVSRCMRMYNIDTVFHLAAMSHVDLSFGNSCAFFENNVMGTSVMMECARAAGIKRFYHISTDEVYGEVTETAAGLAEHSLLNPTNPYAASKVGAEACVQSFVKSFKIPAVIIRLNNVMGPHQYPEKVIPKFINLLRRGRPLLLHGDGLHTRRYLYAGDAAEAFDTILHKGKMGETYNVDSEYEYSNLQVAQKLLKSFGVEDSKDSIQHTRNRAFNDRRYAVDGTKLRKLGWIQRTAFDEALASTVDWYNRFPGWWGDVEGVLSAHPEVHGSDVVPESKVHWQADQDVDGGAQYEPKAKMNGHKNGVMAASKKRKTDLMSEE
ncbi:hypothetical protein AMS68_000857 [Peltaster fructicola]|uniref:NAD(P)-binding domain-containing protein n=1 Tax=Peltaster fructicola TaxID=286661 RepID=A0A6H0XLG1_9PEZI|nr:hypothetical protein AMS68_000857 [Peltaster fructicola]